MSEWEEDGNPWRVRGVTHPFENAWFRLDAHDVIDPSGREATYTVVHARRLSVGVLPIDQDGFVHMVGQWRFALGRYSWEMPEGGAEPGEAPLDCAARELAEETGLRAEAFLPLLQMDLSNSTSDEEAVIFLALGLRPGPDNPDPTEVLRRRRAPFKDVLERVADGRIRDAMTVAAVLRAHHMAVTGALPAEITRAMLA